MATAEVPYYSVDDYLRLEARSEEKYEYYRGTIYAMAGGKPNHNLITTRLIQLLMNKLEHGPCQAFSNDQRVKTKDDFYAYPDIAVVCDEPIYEKRQGLETLLNPKLLVEVASPSTERYDRGGKYQLYQDIDSLQEYLIVAQDQPRVDHFTRQDDGWFSRKVVDREIVKLTKLGIELSLSDIYQRIVFPSTPARSSDLQIVRDFKPEA
jgi:Uma2 family endonuclease